MVNNSQARIKHCRKVVAQGGRGNPTVPGALKLYQDSVEGLGDLELVLS